MGASPTVEMIVPAGMFTSRSLRFVKRAMPCAFVLGTEISLVIASDPSELATIDNARAGMLPVMDTDSSDSPAETGMIAVCVRDSGYKVTVARGTNRLAMARTAITPTIKALTRPGRDVRHAASFSYTSSRTLRRSRRGALGIRVVLGAEAGHESFCAAAVESNTGISRDSASRRTFARRVTSPNCEPSESECRCKTFRSSTRKVTFSYLGQTSNTRGVFAHESLSRTETRSSWDSSVMIWVFKGD